MNTRTRQCVGRLVVLLSITLFCAPTQLVGQTVAKTRIVLLGTGAPAPDPDHSGPATAIVVNDTAYLIDLGPGVVRRASAAFAHGIAALEPTRLRVAFITHLHSDHTLGYPIGKIRGGSSRFRTVVGLAAADRSSRASERQSRVVLGFWCEGEICWDLSGRGASMIKWACVASYFLASQYSSGSRTVVTLRSASVMIQILVPLLRV